MMAVLVVIIIIYFEPIWKILDLFRLEFSHIMSAIQQGFRNRGVGGQGGPQILKSWSSLSKPKGQNMTTTLLLASPSVFQTFLRPCYMYVLLCSMSCCPPASHWVCLSVCLYKSWNFFEVLRNKICSLFPLFFLCVSKKR